MSYWYELNICLVVVYELKLFTLFSLDQNNEQLHSQIMAVYHGVMFLLMCKPLHSHVLKWCDRSGEVGILHTIIQMSGLLWFLCQILICVLIIKIEKIWSDI